MKKILAAFIVLAFVVSCKKAGTGGKATIVAYMKHHDERIKGATLYVKFNADELPAEPTTDYDLKLVADADKDYLNVGELKAGKYFLYAEGYDSTANVVVKGGIGYKIKCKERKEEIPVTVPVTEE